MDANNVADLKALAPQEEQRRIHLFMEVVAGKETMDVPILIILVILRKLTA